MENFDEAFAQYLSAHRVAREDLEVDESVFDEWSKDILFEFIDVAAPGILMQIKKDARVGLRRERQQRKRFEARLWDHWRKPLDLLEMMVDLAQEIGRQFAMEFSQEPGNLNLPTFRALSAIHARACQITRAILALLRAGFADDAHARWRSLHELAVAAAFIAGDKDGDVAERYLLHETIQQRKLAYQYKEYQGRAGLDPITQEEIDDLDWRRKSLIEKFGKPFGENYGWAANKLGKPEPSFFDIEKHVKMDHVRPYYKMASDNVHPNAHGTLFKLGLDDRDRSFLLAGASNLGLAEPGIGAAMSLTQATTSFVTLKSSVRLLVYLRVLDRLHDETGEAFFKADEAAKQIAEDKRQKATGLIK